MRCNIDVHDLSCEEVCGPISADVVIVGSGPAGVALAISLANTSWSVLVVESGDQDHETAFSRELNIVDKIGQVDADFRQERNRIVGGTSLTWSGRCRPLDMEDYEIREYVDKSGWPITFRNINKYLPLANKLLNLQPLNYDGTDAVVTWSKNDGLGMEQFGLRNIAWQFSNSSSLVGDYVRCGPLLCSLQAKNVRLITNATVTELIPSDDRRRIDHVKIQTPRRKTYTVSGRYIALCAGGVENPRLLLMSKKGDPRGVGNSRGVVGRYLMDHPRTTVGTFPRGSDSVVQKSFGIHRISSGAVVQQGVSWSSEALRTHQLLNGAAWTTQHVSEDDVWRAARRLLLPLESGRWRHAAQVLRNADQIMHGLCRVAVNRQLPRRLNRVDMDVTVEQIPNPDSRITLSDKVDAFGNPRARIEWCISDREKVTAIGLGEAFNSSLASCGMPQAILRDWVKTRRPEDATFEGMSHPIGTTRMADSAADGVVDANCLVHGMTNLYISGSSVFSTAGHANPTLMIVSLALRLGDHIAQKLSESAVPDLSSSHLDVTEVAPDSTIAMARS